MFWLFSSNINRLTSAVGDGLYIVCLIMLCAAWLNVRKDYALCSRRLLLGLIAGFFSLIERFAALALSMSWTKQDLSLLAGTAILVRCLLNTLAIPMCIAIGIYIHLVVIDVLAKEKTAKNCCVWAVGIILSLGLSGLIGICGYMLWNDSGRYSNGNVFFP